MENLEYRVGAGFERRNGRLPVKIEYVDSTQIKHYEANIDRTLVHWIEAGKGEPIVLLHTIFGGWDHFRPTIPYFANEFRVVIPHLPGLGPKGKGRELPYPHTLRGFSQFLNHFGQKLGLEKFHLVGSSLGSLISLRCATDYPEKPYTLTLQATPTEFPNLVKTAARFILHPDFVKLWKILPWQVIFEFMKRDPNLPGTDEEKMVWAARVKQGSFKAFAEVNYSILHTDLAEKVKSLVVPTLVVDGYNAILPTREGTKRLASIIPNCTGPVFIPDAGHNLPREKPEEFAKTVLQFIWEVESKTKT